MAMSTEATYLTGEPICKGDSVRYCDWEGVVESIITKDSDGWSDYWHNLGEGVMLSGSGFGRLYTVFHDEHLVFLRREAG
jgi:hypothetical protein